MDYDVTLKKILEAGNAAPSGENCQPWQFRYDNKKIEIFLLPERDQSLYGHGNRASYMANGAAIENIVIAAREFGFEPSVSYFPEPGNDLHVANVELYKTAQKKDPLYASIHQRVTNRKKYEESEISPVEIELIKKETGAINNVSFHFVTEKKKMKSLGVVGSWNEDIMLSNPHIHHFFFSHVNWTKQEDFNNKIGFYIETLELPKAAKAMFKVLSNWWIMRILKIINFNKIVATQNAAVYRTGAGIGILVAKGNSKEDYLNSGRTLERIWLKVTSLGYSLQPLSGLLFLRLRIIKGHKNHFAQREIKLIEEGYAEIARCFNIKKGEIVFMFRIGRAEEPTARSIRFPIDHVSVKI